jgi:hypothetical protein
MHSKPVWIDRFSKLEIYSFPLRTGNAMIIGLFTMMFSYILAATLLIGLGGLVVTITLAYVSFSFFFGYLFVIFEYTTLGFQEIPKMNAGLVFNERGRLMKAMILVSFFFSLFFFIESPFWQVFFTIISLLLIPVATSLLVLEDSFTSAINPAKWLAILNRIEANTGLSQYLSLQICMLLSGYVAFFVNLGWLNILTMMIFLSIAMTSFRCLGVVLHNNAESLGFQVIYGPKIEQEQVQRAHDQALSDFTSTLYTIAGNGETGKALKMLNERLQEDHYKTELDLFDQIRAWENPALAIQAGREFLNRLVASGDIRTSWKVLEFCYQANGNKYRLTSASTLITLSVHPETFKQKTMTAYLLRHFGKDFPNHPKTAEMLLLAARLTAHDLNDFETARHIMAQLASDFPAIHNDKTYRALEAVLTEQGG